VPTYGYNNNQALLASQPQPQWGQQAGAQAYDLSYQTYSAADPGPFQQHHQGYDADADYGDEFYEDEEPRRGKRWLLIAVALVGAIGVGGALAYTYKSLIAPHTGRVPLVRADPNVKVKPAERKLPAPAPSARDSGDQEETASSEKVGPRSVKTIPIAPGGAQPAPVTPSIPGITLYQPPSAQPEAEPQVPSAPVVPPPPAAQIPPRATLPPPVARAPATEPEDDEPLPAKRPPPVQAPAVAAVRPPPPPPAPRPPASSGLGYVAVLSSQKTSMDALKVFADLQQKYGNILDDKAPDVQEADLSERGLGMMYRLVVGPPGSKNAALGVCQQLKSAGYQGCWVKEY
jgi:hypothetical protein